jgi:hypothetical protein
MGQYPQFNPPTETALLRLKDLEIQSLLVYPNFNGINGREKSSLFEQSKKILNRKSLYRLIS